MTIDIAPKAAESAHTRSEGVKGDRLKAAGGGSMSDAAGEFAGLLSQAEVVDEPAEPGADGSGDAKAASAQALAPGMDPAAMLALLSGGKADDASMAADQSVPGQAAPSLLAGAKGALRATSTGGAKLVLSQADGRLTESVTNAKSGAGAARAIAPATGGDVSESANGSTGSTLSQTDPAMAALLPGDRGDMRSVQISKAMNEASPLNLLALGGRVEGAARASGGSLDKALDTFGQPVPDSQVPGPVASAPSFVNPSTQLEAPSLQMSDAMLADTVSYWVTQGVQNAELTLDGFGGQPIEVSIQMTNGEAQIGFRSDLPETRQVIEDAMAQLRDSLASQGLVLAGVSVGTSSRQDGSAGELQRRQTGRRLRGISLTDTATARTMPRLAGSIGRTLDLFA